MSLSGYLRRSIKMPLYLDTEFNGYKGELISIGIWNPVHMTHFYAERNLGHIRAPLTPFILSRVIPKFDAKYKTEEIAMRESLVMYLNSFAYTETIYADWAEDFIHLLGFICGPNGLKYLPRLKMELITTPDNFISKKPHHALWDAEALYVNHNFPNWREGDAVEWEKSDAYARRIKGGGSNCA